MTIALVVLTQVAFVVAVTFLAKVTVLAQVPELEINALFELFVSTHGTTWQWRNESILGPRWNFTRDEDGNFVDNPCSSGWQGVNCTKSSSLCAVETCQITQLIIPDYNLTGTIPREIGDLVVLKRLDFTSNSLSGSIPTEIGQLLSLEILALSNNAITVSTPFDAIELDDDTFLEDDPLYGSNQLTGSIPSEIGNLMALKTLELYGNSLTGSLPTEIGNLLALEWLYLSYNSFTGPLIDDIFNLVALRWIDIDVNQFSGSISSEIFNLIDLERFQVFDNLLTGSVPSEVGNLLSLQLLNIFDNRLTGLIPSEIGNLADLEFLILDFNMLTGSIPDAIENLTNLVWLDLNDNTLTGSLPRGISKLIALQVIDLEYNSFSGPIPNGIGNLEDLELLFLNNNALTQSIPSEISKLGNLEYLFLQSNSLSGSMDKIFNASKQIILEVVDLSNNMLTGSYSNSIFLLPEIRVLALSVNCFEEKLPSSVCEATNIEVMSLNGLGSAEGCQNIVKFPFSDVSLFNTIGGTLPDCIWNLQYLAVLHLTGNGLTGKIVSQLPDDTRITDLLLSHNQLSGTIPFQIEMVESVDLSYNQFSGNFEDSTRMWTNNVLDLDINRLSGKLPAKLKEVSELNILRGNMFSCDSIPSNDEFEKDYTCGSEDLNESLYVFSSALFVVCCFAVVAYFAVETARRTSSSSSSSKTLSSLSLVRDPLSRLNMYMKNIEILQAETTLQPIKVLSDKCKSVSWFFVQLLFVTLVIGTPLYIVRGTDEEASSTHTNTYTWFWTVAYLHGVVPSSLILMTWVVTVAACFYRILLAPLIDETLPNIQPWNSLRESHDASSDETTALNYTILKYYGVLSGVFLVNMAVVMSVNALYIYFTQQPLSDLLRLVMQFSLAVFRLVYSYGVLPILAKTIADPVLNIGFRLRLQMMNNLVIPCLVTVFASPSCFQGLIVEADAVSTPYGFEVCDLFFIIADERVCVEWIEVEAESVDVIPPFIYNNQCASVILTSYIPVLIFGFAIQIVTCFLLPFLFCQVEKQTESGLSKIVYSKTIRGLLWPDFWLISENPDIAKEKKAKLEKDPLIVLNTKSILCFDILNNLMIMLSFGLCSPILAIAVVCTVVSKICVLLLSIGRFLYVLRKDSDDSMHFAVAALCKVDFPLTEVLEQSFWVLVWTSALFFSLVCWDIAGDSVGWAASIWIPITTMCYPIVLWVIARCVKSNGTVVSNGEDSGGIKLALLPTPQHEESSSA